MAPSDLQQILVGQARIEGRLAQIAETISNHRRDLDDHEVRIRALEVRPTPIGLGRTVAVLAGLAAVVSVVLVVLDRLYS